MMRVILFLLVVLASNAHAVTLCGTVRDAVSNAPVAGAAVFLLDEFGASTGINTGTSVDGTWCLDDISAGTYSIVVTRDDYQLARVDDIVVDDTSTDVSIAANSRVLFAAVAPNPTSSRATLRWRVPDGQRFQLEVFDLRGRRVTGWDGVGRGDDRRLVWDLRGFDGRALAGGSYFAVLKSGGVRVSRRVVVVR